MMYFFFLIGGMILEFFIERYLRYLYRKISNRQYEVTSFSRKKEEDGTYKIWFKHPSGDIEEGYTKKCPPIGVFPSDIYAKLRFYNKKRFKYRVFWEKH